MGSTSAKYLNDSVSTTMSSVFKQPSHFVRGEESTVAEPSMFSLKAEDNQDTAATKFSAKGGPKSELLRFATHETVPSSIFSTMKSSKNAIFAESCSSGQTSWLPHSWQAQMAAAQMEPTTSQPGWKARDKSNDLFALECVKGPRTEATDN